MKCPKCNYERKAQDDAPSWQCPSCKVAYAKAAQAQPTSNNIPAQRSITSTTTTTTTSKLAGDFEASDDSELQALAASGQKIVIYCIVANFVLRAVDQTHSLSVFVMQALYAVTAVISLIGIVRICSGLQKSQGAKITFMMLSFWPLVNLISLIYLSAKTNRILRDAGWRTGLFGAKP